MLISYDPDTDALHIELGNGPPATSRKLNAGTDLDFDKLGNLIGLQMLDVTDRLGKDAVEQLIVEGLATLVRPGEPMEIFEVMYRSTGEIAGDAEASVK